MLGDYGTAFLDQMSAVLLAITVVSYIMYTVSPAKVEEVGSYALTYSAVFVLYGVFRYLYLVHQKSRGKPDGDTAHGPCPAGYRGAVGALLRVGDLSAVLTPS